MVMSSRMLAAIRQKKERWLKDSCTIEERTGPLDDLGGENENHWQVVVEDVKCRVIRNRKLASQTTEYAATESMMDEYRIIVPFGTNLNVGQRVTVAEKVHFVTGVIDELTDQTDAQALMVRERDGSDGSG